MIEPQSTLIVLLAILTLGLVIPELFKKLKFPFVTTIIILGAVLGPNGLGYIQPDEVISFFGFLGMTFLMLMAGLETDMSKLKRFKDKVAVMAAINGFVPFAVGVTITRLFGYPWMTSLVVGIVFISSSVAIIVPSLQSLKISTKKIGQLILSSVIITDIVSLIVLGMVLQSISPITRLPLPVYFLILFASIGFLFYTIPRLSKYTIQKRFIVSRGYERQLRFVVVITVAVLIYFSYLGVHPILAAFLVGLMLSGVVYKEYKGSDDEGKPKTVRGAQTIIYDKLHTLSYGIFVPVFFFIVGMEMDLYLFEHFDIGNLLMISLISGLIFSKLTSGYVAGRLVKFSKKNSLVFGSISIVQLTTTLAVTYSASSLGLLDPTLVTSIILLSIITTIAGPLAVSHIASSKIR